ncbi:MAG: hypothetical protein L0271_17380 [Gemmatimonadetes bacterium]|nr:hypothetical protein [Gemmatimonadota bacterium]
MERAIACGGSSVPQLRAGADAPSCHGDMAQEPRGSGGCVPLLTRQRCCCIDDAPAGIPAQSRPDSACTVSSPSLPYPVAAWDLTAPFWQAEPADGVSSPHARLEQVPIYISHRALLI